VSYRVVWLGGANRTIEIPPSLPRIVSKKLCAGPRGEERRRDERNGFLKSLRNIRWEHPGVLWESPLSKNPS